jgi:hypothetical protein
MRKFALYCGLLALAGAAFCVGEAVDDTVYVWASAADAGRLPGRVKALFR